MHIYFILGKTLIYYTSKNECCKLNWRKFSKTKLNKHEQYVQILNRNTRIWLGDENVCM